MAKLLCTGAQTCIHKKNCKGINVCGKFEDKADCIHSVSIEDMKKRIEEV